jgi:hypothetical protein
MTIIFEDAKHCPKWCRICGCLLNDPNEPVASQDCGGDCLQCMAVIGEDPDCIAALEAAKKPTN